MEMEIDEKQAKSCKRKADEEENVDATAEDDALVIFFGEFRVPTIFWGVYKKIENMGILYLHRGTNKPLAIIRRVNPENNHITGYNLYFQTDEEKEQQLVGMIKLDSTLMGNTEEDKRLAICHTMDQVAEQYIKEGVLEDTEDAMRYCDEFMETLNLERLVDRTTDATKKRRLIKEEK